MAFGSRKGSAQTYEDISMYETLSCCLVCMDSHDKPTQLDCNHVFCEQCLLHYYKLHCRETSHPENGIVIPCPTCQQHTAVPSSGIASLSLEKRQLKSQNRMRKVSMVGDTIAQRCEPCIYKAKTEEADYYCNKCLLNFCQNCKNVHDQHIVFNSHSVIHISNKDAINLYCPNHGKQASVYFCKDCNTPVCCVCVMQDHNTHTNITLADALSIRRDNLKQCLNAVGPRVEKMGAKLKKLIHEFSNNTDHRLKNGSTSSTESISKLKDEDIELVKINPRKDSNDNVDYEIRAIDREIKKLQKLYELSSKLIEMSQSKKLLIVYDELMSRLQTVINVEIDRLQEDIILKIQREMECTMSYPPNGMTPSDSFNSLHDKISKTGTSNKSSPDHSVISLDDSAYDQSDHFLLFKPKLLWKFEKQRSEIPELWNPSGISFHPSGDIIVAEYDILNDKNNRLRIFNSVGQYKCAIAQGQMKPLGVAVNYEGNIAVTDCEGKRVKIYNLEGQLHQEIGKGQFGWPYGIICNSKGQYIISDTFHDTISIFSKDGSKKIKTFGTSGPGSSQFKNPFHISVDSQDNIVISDSGNKCVKVFDIRGEFLHVSSESHRRPSVDNAQRQKRRKLKGPRGIAVDIKDNILVADDSGKVCLLDSHGRYIRNLLTDEDSIKYPEALASNKHGHLAVTEWNPNTMLAIKIFSMYE